MIKTKAYAAETAKSQIAPFTIERRELGAHDVLIDIDYCGVCHSDIHQARADWGAGIFPMVPGHEIIGKVNRVGAQVKNFKAGDAAGVGCFVDSCRECASCHEGLEQYCSGHIAYTYNGLDKDKKTPTYGGYSKQIVVDSRYVLRMPTNIPADRAAPLLCAGITTYSPLKHWKVGPGHKVAVVGLGGLGHMGVKFAAAMGAEVTVLSTSPNKEKDARELGAHHFAATRDGTVFTRLANQFDFILDTVAAPHDLNAYLGMLKRDGSMVLVGIPDQPAPVHAFSVIQNRRSLAGSSIGGIAETQEMLDYCAEKGIACDVEVIPMQKINEAYERMIRGDVRYRFVIDLKTL